MLSSSDIDDDDLLEQLKGLDTVENGSVSKFFKPGTGLTPMSSTPLAKMTNVDAESYEQTALSEDDIPPPITRKPLERRSIFKSSIQKYRANSADIRNTENDSTSNSPSISDVASSSVSISTSTSHISNTSSFVLPLMLTPPPKPGPIQVPETTSPKPPKLEADSSAEDIISQTPVKVNKLEQRLRTSSHPPQSSGSLSFPRSFTSSLPSHHTDSYHNSDTYQLHAIKGYQANIIEKLTKVVDLAVSEINRIRNEYPGIVIPNFDIDMDILTTDLEASQNKLSKIQNDYNQEMDAKNESITMSPVRERKRRKYDTQDRPEFSEEVHDIITVSSGEEEEEEGEEEKEPEQKPEQGPEQGEEAENEYEQPYEQPHQRPHQQSDERINEQIDRERERKDIDRILDDIENDFSDNEFNEFNDNHNNNHNNHNSHNNDHNMHIDSTDESFPRNPNDLPQQISDDSDCEMTDVVHNNVRTDLSQYVNDVVDEVEEIGYNPYAVVNPSSPAYDNDFDNELPSQSGAVQAQSQLPSYPWTREVFTTLKATFKLSGFRQNQLEAINATLNGSDVLVLMPTGGGKSLCFQLPALIKSGKTHGVTIVISPLLSLMQDQVQQLKEKHINAEMINSQLTGDEKRHNRNLLFNNLLDLVYLSPELLRTTTMLSGLKRLHSKGQIARIVIDEAHCVSAWGHDFRPQYKELEEIKSEFPGVPIIALTATATSLVKLDIQNCLRENCLQFKQTFNRPNLSYEIHRAVKNSKETGAVYSGIKQIMDKYKNDTGIIYCRTQSQCEELAKRLKSDRYRVEYYHGGLDTETRVRIQSEWQSGEIKAVCATVAFGMGIDKPDVRYVIHESMPRTMEGYYQETGRAGRDGNPSECIMFYSFQDFMSLMSAIERDRDLTYERKQHQKQLLNSMMQYCENEIDCRRRIILNYFNEVLPKTDICKKTCDNCKQKSQKNISTIDITPIAVDFINLVSYIEKDKISPAHCISVYRGSKIKKTLDLGHDRAPGFGKGKTKTIGELERIISHLIQQNILKDVPKPSKFGGATATIYKGREADKVLSGQRKVEMQFVTSKSGPVNKPPPSSSSRKRQFMNDNTQDDM